MTLRRFLDVAYAILHEEYQRLGLNLIEASERLDIYRAQTMRDEPQPDRDEAAVARQNEAEYQRFQQLMGGVG